MSAPTPQEVQAAQGTRLEKEAPWKTYDLQEKLPPELEAEITAYAEHVHPRSSNQSKEELARQKEINNQIAKEYQWCTPEEYEDIQSRFGKVMHSSELITKLRDELHIKCWYREHLHADKLTLLVQRGDGMRPPEIACWVQNGFMPEFTVMGFDDHGAPLAEKYRGWRTCLLQLIMGRITTEEQAHKVFGATDRSCSGRYNNTLWGIRNTVKESE